MAEEDADGMGWQEACRMPLRAPPVARLRPSGRGHATAATLAAVLTLLLTLFTLGSSDLAAEEAGCVHDRAAAVAAGTTPCPQVAVDAPGNDQHPGHDPSSAPVSLVATSTHRQLCHTPLPAIDSPAISGPLPAAAAPTDPAPGVTADCPQRTTQRQILRC
ncbi:hypothetical protein [Streptomyces smyrnaeus]|uniref:hypothetical protein n=1 Tax=Streptomyces smyrnaeus TaxID=1387713 RepID=UPI00340B95EA